VFHTVAGIVRRVRVLLGLYTATVSPEVVGDDATVRTRGRRSRDTNIPGRRARDTNIRGRQLRDTKIRGRQSRDTNIRERRPRDPVIVIQMT
jgi:hypothetical protein